MPVFEIFTSFGRRGGGVCVCVCVCVPVWTQVSKLFKLLETYTLTITEEEGVGNHLPTPVMSATDNECGFIQKLIMRMRLVGYH